MLPCSERTVPPPDRAAFQDRDARSVFMDQSVEADSSARSSTFGELRTAPSNLPAVVGCLLFFVESAGVSASDKEKGGGEGRGRD